MRRRWSIFTASALSRPPNHPHLILGAARERSEVRSKESEDEVRFAKPGRRADDETRPFRIGTWPTP